MKDALQSVIQDAYSGVHRWLESRSDTDGYMENYGNCRNTTLMKDIAAQFARYFPAHHFKTINALNETVQRETLCTWLEHTPSIAIVDMGCGGGAASAAMISVLHQLHSDSVLPVNVKITCIGVDPSANALGVYYQLISRINDATDGPFPTVAVRVVDRPVAESVTDLDHHLKDLLHSWNQPALSHVFLLQSNIVSPLGLLYNDQNERRDILTDLGVPAGTYIEEGAFGTREARSYLQLFRQLPIDNLHVVTVATDQQGLEERVEHIGTSIGQLFSAYHVHTFGAGKSELQFYNPVDSFWKVTQIRRASDPKYFHFDVRSVENCLVASDAQWHEVLDIDNLRLAWARVRLIRTREAISDVIEIRLFERYLEDNLKQLRLKLKSYDKYVAMTDDRFSYEFPKKEDGGRPYVLPRLEEDIVSVAIVQVLGRLAFGLQNTSFAYRPHDNFPRSTEHLYRSWFDAFRRFKDEVSIGVSLETNCNVLETDIESYFTSIEQGQLVNTVVRELRTQSSRVKWLLERLFLVDLVDLEGNPCKQGLAQGAAGSGFYANAFLAPLDSEFGVGNVRYYRYMDDICLVIPEDVDEENVQSRLDISLAALGLKRNCEKTKQFDFQSFRDHWDSGYELDDISARFTRLTNSIWYANGDYRSEAMRNEKWWDFIDRYRKHLRSIDIYVEADRLSRKLHQYLSRRKRRNDLRSGLVVELKFPVMNSAEWARQFLNVNTDWNKERVCVKAKLDSKLRSAFDELLKPTSENASHDKRIKELASVVVFCANRLPRLGVAGTEDILTEILRDRPTTISQPGYILRSLADQGFSDEVLSLMERFANLDFAAAPYYLALAIESVCHLPVIEDSTFDRIMSLALDTCQHAIVRLKATETLLRSSPDSRNLPTENILTVAKDEKSTRLVKNYLLLLAEAGCDVDDYFDHSDYLVQSVIPVGKPGGTADLFKCIEPDIIRKRYYGWEYTDDPTEYTTMPIS